MAARALKRRIGLCWVLPCLSAVALSNTPEVHAETVAVMPVRGLNLSQPECDAIGDLVARAFRRETRAEVLSPTRTGPAFGHARSSAAAAAELGAAEYIELDASKVEANVTLVGIRFDRNGNEISRAESTDFSVDQMDAATAHLVHALACRPAMVQGCALTAQPAKAAHDAVGPDVSPPYPKALGIKVGAGQPMASGRTFAPILLVAFDARFGPREYFWEFGGGAAVATSTSSQKDKAELQGLFLEAGLSGYLSKGKVAPYAGGGISPRLWAINNTAVHDGIKCAIFGHLGITFTRDSRARLYSEVRVSQNIIGIPEEDPSAPLNSPPLATYYPVEITLHVGAGW